MYMFLSKAELTNDASSIRCKGDKATKRRNDIHLFEIVANTYGDQLVDIDVIEYG